MKPNKPYENTYENRVAQFKKEEKIAAVAQKQRKTTVTTSSTDTKNPYLRARIEILNNYPEWRKNEIIEMERIKNTDNRAYNDFVHDVAVLGDTYMPLC